MPIFSQDTFTESSFTIIDLCYSLSPQEDRKMQHKMIITFLKVKLNVYNLFINTAEEFLDPDILDSNLFINPDMLV